MTKLIDAKLIMDARPNEETLAELMGGNGLSTDQMATFMVFEINHLGKKMYCSWSGGRIGNDGPEFTPIGNAALEALLNIPINAPALVFQHMQLGKTPLIDKLKSLLDKLEANTKICFFGDIEGELDGQIGQVFKILDVVKINH